MRVYYYGFERGKSNHIVYDQPLSDKNVSFTNNESASYYSGMKVKKLKNNKLEIGFLTYMDHDPNGKYIFKIEVSKKELLFIMKNELKNTRVKDLLF